jgi:sugar/nucleoside kinase (ribokinase family)
VAVVGEDFPKSFRDVLAERPIDLTGLQVKKDGKTFRWKGKYEHDMNVAQTLDTQLNVLLDFQPKVEASDDIPFVFLANIDPALQMQVLKQVKKPKLKLVACDTMNFWITSKRKELGETLKHIDVLVVNDGEARQLTHETNLMKAARQIQAMGPDKVVIKKGEHGVLLFYGEQFFSLPAYLLETVFDPTGAGDTFAGGMMGYLAKTQDTSFEGFKKAVAYGSVVASFTVEEFSLNRLRKITLKDIELRLAEFKKLMHF